MSTLAENLEVLNLRAIAGEYDLQERHIDIAKLPVILENQEKGDYTVHLDPAFNGSDAIYQFNQSYDADPEIAKWLTNADFRRALSLGHRPRPAQRDVLARRRHCRIAGTGREPALLPGRGLAREVVGLRPRAGERPPRPDRAHREGFRGLPAAHRQW